MAWAAFNFHTASTATDVRIADRLPLSQSFASPSPQILLSRRRFATSAAMDCSIWYVRSIMRCIDRQPVAQPEDARQLDDALIDATHP